MRIELPLLFKEVSLVMLKNQAALNLADLKNHNHGDHMVQIFQLASRAAEEKRSLPLHEAMQYAAQLLKAQEQNGSAQVYSSGLSCFAEQFHKHDISLDELVDYVHGILFSDLVESNNKVDSHASSSSRGKIEIVEEKSTGEEDRSSEKSGKALKALVSGLAAWSKVEKEPNPSDTPLDMGILFEFGMAYLQAKKRGGSQIEILADTAASVSPLSEVPNRYDSGKLAIRSLLCAMQGNISDLVE